MALLYLNKFHRDHIIKFGGSVAEVMNGKRLLNVAVKAQGVHIVQVTKFWQDSMI
jgi:hypothetical protein